MTKKYDDEDGVWRTVGGRRIFIKNGQDLASAMKESGKFSRVARNKDLYKKLKEEGKKDEVKEKNAEKEKTLEEQYAEDLHNGKTKGTFQQWRDKKEGKEPTTQAEINNLERIGERKVSVPNSNDKETKSNNWRDEVKKNNEQLEKDLKKYQETHDMARENEGYYELFRENERRNAKIKQEIPEEPYEFVEAYAGYRDKSYKLAGTKENGKEIEEYGTKSWSGKEYTNDEFMEHLEDSNWHSERKQLLDANLTNQELAYIKDHTTLSQWSVGEELTGKENTQKLIDEAKAKFSKTSERDELAEISGGVVSTLKTSVSQSKQERLKPGTEIYYEGDQANIPGYFTIEKFEPEKEQFLASVTLKEKGGEGRTFKIGAQSIDDDYGKTPGARFSFREDYNNYRNKIFEQYAQKYGKYSADSEFKKSHHLGWGDYNKDGIPVYDNKIDYKGDFGLANLKTLSNEELTQALNVQSSEYHLAMNEKIGDKRTRNGRMDSIFKNAKTGKYEQGMKKINEEMEKRKMPRYNIYDEKNNTLLVSSPTKEMAERQLKEIQETDKSLQKSYGWKELPSYKVVEEKTTVNKINNSLVRAGYKKYMKEHPNSKMTFEEYKNM